MKIKVYEIFTETEGTILDNHNDLVFINSIETMWGKPGY